MDLICWKSLKSQVTSIFKRADWKPTAVEAPHRSSEFLDLNWVSARNVLLANHLRCLIKLYRFVLTLEFCEIYWKPISDILEVKERRSKGLGGTTSILKSLIPQEPQWEDPVLLSATLCQVYMVPLLGTWSLSTAFMESDSSPLTKWKIMSNEKKKKENYLSVYSAKTTTWNCWSKIPKSKAGPGSHTWLAATWPGHTGTSWALGARSLGHKLPSIIHSTPRPAWLLEKFRKKKHHPANNGHLFKTKKGGRESGNGAKTIGVTRDEFQPNDTHHHRTESKTISAPKR